MRAALTAWWCLAALVACSEYDLTGQPDPEPEPGEPGAPPEAQCSAAPDTVNPPHEDATFDGTDSTGSLVSYEWRMLTAPTGSSLEDAVHDRATWTVTPDLAGEYEARLTVTDEDGLTSSCEATLTASPTAGLWVEMFWAQPADDMDLHLLAPGGEVNTATDCYFANCKGSRSPDWGVTGVEEDDPTLDLDDIDGTGPENINILAPADGLYTVIVHDFRGSTLQAANDVTVKVYLWGNLEWSATRPIAGEDSYVTFATIDTATWTVSPQ